MAGNTLNKNLVGGTTLADSKKPLMSFWQIFNMSFGFLGIQFGFALQNGNASRMLQIFGANVENISWFWLVAPIAGMVVQPLIGYYSDRTWTSLGRRKPFFLAGAILASMGLMLMPNAGLLTALGPPLIIGAGVLMIMDASFNVAMEPFRALVADNLPESQLTKGFAVQTFLIGIGAVVGSYLPTIFHEYFGVSNVADKGHVPQNLTISFYVGAVVFLIAILWTVLTTKEFPPEENYKALPDDAKPGESGLQHIVRDFINMPKTMKQLGLVQFFSWFGLFSMWVFMTSAVATHVYGLSVNDNSSAAFQNAGDKVSASFGMYNFVSAIFAISLLPYLAKHIGKKATHALSLVCGGLGLISIYFVHDPEMLKWSMVGVGIAWASILAMPYAILASAIPPQKMGLYVGIFNLFITLPQIVNGVFGGPIVKYVLGSQPIYYIVIAGVIFLLAAASVMVVEDKN